MKVFSFVREGSRLIEVEVEVQMWPGLPQFIVVGRADEHIKESLIRVRSALRAQGFEIPRAKQVVFNLKPSFLRKSSQGLELALATAFILHNQKPPDTFPETIHAYGELSLSGDVFPPSDVATIGAVQLLLTGAGPHRDLQAPKPDDAHGEALEASDLESPSLRLKNLAEIFHTPIQNGTRFAPDFQRPTFAGEFLWNQTEADVLAMIAAGEHSAILAGTAGSGKTTLASHVHGYLQAPRKEHFLEWRSRNQSFPFRPLSRPHHTTPVISMLGGGSRGFMGEIPKAHGGVLMLDEFLEFPAIVLESLREPLEEKIMRVSRAGDVKTFQADVLTLATTNLCPCGFYVPGHRPRHCGFTLQRCQSTLNRLSGPLLDRFQVLFFFSKTNPTRDICGARVLEKIQAAQDFRIASRGQQQPNSSLPDSELLATISKEVLQVIPEHLGSQRRRSALLRLARTLADLEESPYIGRLHIQQALPFAWGNFQALRRPD